MGRPQFSRPEEAWSWEESAQNLVGAIVPTAAFAVVLWINYPPIYSFLAVVLFSISAIFQVVLDRRTMMTG